MLIILPTSYQLLANCWHNFSTLRCVLADLLVIRSEYISFNSVLNSLVHPHQGFFNVGQSTGVFPCGKLAALKAFKTITDDFKQIRIKYPVNGVGKLSRTVLELYFCFLGSFKPYIGNYKIRVIRTAVSFFVRSKNSVEFLPFLDC